MQVEVFAMVCWAVWSETCKKSHSQGGFSTDFNVDWVYSLWDTFLTPIESCDNKIEDLIFQQRFLIPPAQNQWILNVDAGFDDMK